MKFNYKLKRLCGAYYGNPSTTDSYGSTGRGSGSNILYTSDGNTLVSAVSNRIQIIDLKSQTVRTLPVEARSNIRCMALSPDDMQLLVVDVQNYTMLVNLIRGVVLHRFKFKRTVRQAAFSPCGQYVAVTHGRHVQVWLTPNVGGGNGHREFSPLVLHRTYVGQTSDTTHLEWSSDSSVLMACSKDGTARIWTVHTTLHYHPVTLSGHKTALRGAFFVYDDTYYDKRTGTTRPRIDGCYTISEDGALVSWKIRRRSQTATTNSTTDDSPQKNKNHPFEDIEPPRQEEENEDEQHLYDFEAQVDDAVDFFSGGGGGGSGQTRQPSMNDSDDLLSTSQGHDLVFAKWSYGSRHYFNDQDSAAAGAGTGGRTGGQRKVMACTYNHSSRLLAVGFSSGIFGIYEMPSVANIHTLSVGSNQWISTCILNKTGEWLALACPKSQQLLIWEWRSETYILKQRGHAYGMRCMAYSPDGVVVCTGGEDGKLKLWNASSGFCYVTLEQSHQAPVTAVCFANASVVLSASLDGTVRAHDLHRYRTFKTLTTPTPVQFLSLAVDPSGEIVTAGTMDPFHIYAWNLQTGKLLDVLTGHTGPVSQLAYQSQGGTLASSSWDGTVKLWDLYKGNDPIESLQHNSDVICVACRPDGKEVCSGTIRGLLSFWDVESGKLKFEIDGRRDIAGGRKLNDRMTADNNASSRYFTSIAYSADGSCLLAGGNSKFVCIYEISQQILLKKFQVTFNRSLDGVLDELNSKNMTEFGPIDDHADNSEDETTYNTVRLPGAKRGDDGSRSSRVEVLTAQVSFSSTGREWAAVSGEGLHVYSLDDDMIFDPISLTESITPASVEYKLASGGYSMALRMALHLNEFALITQVLDEIPYSSIPNVVQTVGPEQLERLMNVVAKIMETSPHIQYYLRWCLDLLRIHGIHMEKHRSTFMRAFRAMHKIIQTRHDELKTICNENKYMLEFLECHSTIGSA